MVVGKLEVIMTDTIVGLIFLSLSVLVIAYMSHPNRADLFGLKKKK